MSAPADSPRFYRCLPAVLVHEIGWSNHPSDPDGVKNQGITLTTFRRHFGGGCTKQDLRNITVWQVRYVYRMDSWLPCNCDALPPGVDLAVFDGAVTSGPLRSVRWLQAAVGVTLDGIAGPSTLQRLAELPRLAERDTRDFILDMCDLRMRYLRRLASWQNFGREWEQRVSTIQRIALAMARGEEP